MDEMTRRLVVDLLYRLREQRARLLRARAYYAGSQPHPVVSARYRPAYRLLIEMARNPWARLVVDALAERLSVTGIRLGSRSADTAAWHVFRANRMDADQRMVHTEALTGGIGYCSVWPDEVDPGVPIIRAESAEEMVYAPAPDDRRVVLAALKLYPDALAGVWRLQVVQPDRVDSLTIPWRRDADADIPEARAFDDAPVLSEDNPLGVVPVVPFENVSVLGLAPVGEVADLIPILRRIDKLTLDLLLTSESGSFRQRWATGLEVPRDENGNPIEPYEAAVSKLWVSESPDTKFGSFDASDLQGYLAAIDAQIAELAAVSRVPSHYLLQQNLANPPSADSLVSAEAGLLAKIADRQRGFGQSWETVISLALSIAGQTEALDPAGAEVVWAEAAMRSPSQLADALVKLQAVGVPEQALWEIWGASPDEINRWRVMATEQALRDAAAAALAPPTAGAGPPASAEVAEAVVPAGAGVEG